MSSSLSIAAASAIHFLVLPPADRALEHGPNSGVEAATLSPLQKLACLMGLRPPKKCRDDTGGVLSPLPPPPPPPPPSPPPPPFCNTGPYVVFFDWDKSDISSESAAILDNAVSAYGNCGNAAITLEGHTDRSGPDQYNVALSERRNASVRGYLSSRGISGGAIVAQAFGESRPRVATADGVRELQNRRVEITYGPGSGM